MDVQEKAAAEAAFFGVEHPKASTTTAADQRWLGFFSHLDFFPLVSGRLCVAVGGVCGHLPLRGAVAIFPC